MDAKVHNPQQQLPPHQQHLLNLTAAPKRTASGSIRTRTASASAIPTGPYPPTGGTPLTAVQDHQNGFLGPAVSHIPPDVAPHILALRKFDIDLILSWLHLDRQVGLPASPSPGQSFGHYPTFPRHHPRQASENAGRSSSISNLFSAGPQACHPLPTAYNGFPDPQASPFPVQADGQAAWGFDGLSSTATVMPSGAPFSKHVPGLPHQQFVGVTRTNGRPAASNRADQEKKQRYVCTSCEVRFTRRWDWKHHEETVHERWRKFPCPDCNQEFWSENSFNQHHKSAHNCRNCPHAGTVKKDLQKRAAWGCGFCAAVHYSWDDRCKHVASHFDKGQTKDDWNHSNVIYGLLHQPDLLDAWRTLLIENHGQYPDPRPCFNWKPKTTGRQQGVRDGSAITHLQDLLEYSRSTQDVPGIIKKAYDFGIVQSVPSSYKLERRDSSFPLDLASSPHMSPAVPAGSKSTQNGTAANRAAATPNGTAQSPHPQQPSTGSRPTSLPMMTKTNSGAGSDSGVSAITFSAATLLTDQLESLDTGDHFGGSRTMTPRQGMIDPLVHTNDSLNMFYSAGHHSQINLVPGPGTPSDFEFGSVPSAELFGTPPIFSGPSLGVAHQNLSSLSLPASLEHHNSSWQHTPPTTHADASFLQFSHSPAFAPGMESLLSLEKELPVLSDNYGLMTSSSGFHATLPANVGVGGAWIPTVSQGNGGYASSPDSFNGVMSSSIA